MYRPSKRPPKGAWARHLHEQRRLRNLSQVQAFEIVYERMGWSAKSRTAYVSIDMGDRQPRGDEVTILGAEFGWPPDPLDVEEPVTDQGALIAALDRQSKAMEALVAMFAPVVLAQGRKLEKMEAVLEGLVQRAIQDGDGQPVHHETGR